MNFVLHKHNRPEQQIPLPNGLRELMMDLSREVLRNQPVKIPEFIANYLDAMLVVREHTYIAKNALDDLIQFDMDMSDLMKLSGLSEDKAKAAANYLRNELQTITASGCVTEFNEKLILSKLITTFGLSYSKALKVKQIIEESFKTYFYRYISYHDSKRSLFEGTWKEAVERTLDIYRKSKPDQCTIDRAAIIIQAAYRRFHQRNHAKLIKSAIIIQKCFRGYQLRRLLSSSFGSDLLSRNKISVTRSGLGGFIPPFTSIDGSNLSS